MDYKNIKNFYLQKNLINKIKFMKNKKLYNKKK